MPHLDLSWLVPFRWPLVALLVALAIYIIRRQPERNEPWTPPAPAEEPSSTGADEADQPQAG